MRNFVIAMAVLIASIKSPASLPPDYQQLSATEKLNILWNDEIAPNEYADVPSISSLGLLDILKLLSSSFLAKTFDHVSDEMPEGRIKLLHPYGSVVQVRFVPDAKNSESGILKSGAIGLARLSLAGNPNLLGYTPGMGVKFLIDGRPSVNLHVMNSLSGQGSDQNFFAKDFSNVIPAPPLHLVLLAHAFAKVKNPPTELNVNEITKVQSNGSLVSSAKQKSVYQIVFKPNTSLAIDSDTVLDFREELSNIPSGSVLYYVYTRATKTSPLVKAGRLVTTSEFIASSYGDEKLFFQHQR